MKFCLVLASLTATLGHASYEYEWTDYITGDDNVDCGKGSLINGVGCTGSYCDDVRLYCRRGGEAAYSGNSTSYWTEEVSEETEPVVCADDYFATAFSCRGHFCDNVALECTYEDRRKAGTECIWSDWFSEEGTGTLTFVDAYVRGVECKDSFCDSKRVYLCPEVIVPEPTPAPTLSTETLAPSTFEEFAAADIAAQEDSDGVCAYDWTKYAVIDHSKEADSGEAECGSAGALVAGAQCLSHFCDDVRLLCKTCECAYTETKSYWTEEFTSKSTAPTICEDDYFTTGLSCDDSFCSVLKMQCTYNSGRTAGDCHWSDWVSEEGSGQITFSTGFVRGVECKGAYCDDKRFLLCPAIDENETSCSMGTASTATDVSPTAAPTTLLTEDGKVRDIHIQKGGGGGDPHFKTWTGQKFDYHGECDLVLIENPTFANGLGLRVHIRTTRKRYFSFIERIAVQIGSDVLEFANDVDKWLLNGKKRPAKHAKIAGYEVRQLKNFISIRIDDETKAKIDLSRRKNGMPYVVADGGDTAVFDGSSGLLGEWRTGDMVGRDGVTILNDPTTYALEWQVRDTEPMLFHKARFPQFPAVCIPPKKMLGNRLGDTHMRKEAEQICEAWKEDKDDCIFDVMATRNVHSADEYPEEYAQEAVSVVAAIPATIA